MAEACMGHPHRVLSLFFKQYKFECFIEIGPFPTLTGMAVRTLKAKYEAKDDLTSCVHCVFCALKDQKEIYYQIGDEPDATPESDAPAETTTPTPPPMAAVPAIVTASTPPPATANPAASIEDVPIRALDILPVIVSQKLKKRLSETRSQSPSRTSLMASRHFKMRS